MKNLFAVLSIMATLFVASSFTHQASAQIVRAVTISAADDTLVNADTASVVLTFDASFKSVEATVLEVSGTTGGKVYFQGEYLHGTDYANLDSLTLTDVATLQYKLFTVPTVRLYKSFRLYYIKSGSGSAAIKGYYLRYTGGAILRSDPYHGMAWLNNQKTFFRYPLSHYISNWKGDLFIKPERSAGAILFKEKCIV